MARSGESQFLHRVVGRGEGTSATSAPGGCVSSPSTPPRGLGLLRSHLRAGGVHDRPHLDGPKAGGRVVGNDLGRALDALGVEHVVAGQLLLRLGERSAGGGRGTVAPPYSLAG